MNKIKKIGKVTIYNSEYTLKEEEDLSELEHYFISRDFHNYMPVVERIDKKNKYPYLENFSLNREQFAKDIAHTLGLLHNKTSFSKEVSIDKKKSIYDDLLGFINYTEEKMNELLKKVEYKEFPSPSETIFLNNYSKINEAFMFVKRETENWFNIASKNKKERLSLIHGNMSLDHAISNDKIYLINWTNKRFDSPVIDLKKYYDNTWNIVDFSEILEEYLHVCTLTDEEKKLLFISISIPKNIVFTDNEIENVKNVRNSIDYIYKTERLIGPYYTEENKE